MQIKMCCALLALSLGSGGQEAEEVERERFELARTYASPKELTEYLKGYSTWPVEPFEYEGRTVALFTTMWFPRREATSYVLAAWDDGSELVSILDSGFFWQTAKNTRLDSLRYDYDQRIVFYVDDYGTVLGGKHVDLEVSREEAKGHAIPERTAGR